MTGLEQNRLRKALTIASLLFEAGVTPDLAEQANDETKAICGEAARMVLKTQKASKPSGETWNLVLVSLRHMYDERERNSA